MLALNGKKVVVVGGSRGVGKRIVAAAGEGSRVLAVARDEGSLKKLAQETPGIEILSLDAADEGAPSRKRSSCLGRGSSPLPLDSSIEEGTSRSHNEPYDGRGPLCAEAPCGSPL
jgi:NAD(P)-dependent dehydrogenase (short-subunit alcohol dehydrogenase family)